MSQTQAWPPPGTKTRTGTHYVLRGSESGRLVLCIHGIGAYSKCFDALATALANEGYQVLQYDLMGRGWSDAAEDLADYGENGHVAQLHQLLTELGLQNTPKDIVAHSMGGALATLYLDTHTPAQPGKLILLAPAGLMNAGPIKPLRAMKCMHGIVAKVLKGGQEGEWKKDFVVRDGEKFDAMMQMQRDQAEHNKHSFNAFFQSVLHFPLFGIDEQAQRVGKLPLKVLLIWGKQDKAVPMQPSLARWEAVFEPPASLETEIWDHAGHAFFLEHPDRAATRLISFLSQT